MSFVKILSVINDLNDFVEEEMISLSLRIDQRLVLETPLRDGPARANWIVTVNKDTKKFDKKNISQGAALTQAKDALNNAKNFNKLYIQNNLPYIERLNEGHSQQAPALYVDVIIEEEINRSD